MSQLGKVFNRPLFAAVLRVLALGLFIGGGVLGWLSLLWQAPSYTTLLWPIAIITFLGLGWAFYYLWRTNRSETEHLTTEIKSIIVNPAYRLKVQGSPATQHLAQAINAVVNHFQVMLAEQEVKTHQGKADLEAKTRQAKADLEEEKNRLLALMSELSEAVIVCNSEGQILLYNQRAKQLLSQTPEVQPAANGGSGSFIDLGYSIFNLIDRKTITHALEQLYYGNQQQRENLVSKFVTTTQNGQLIRARVAPVLDQQKQLSGFILTLEDITRQLQTSTRRDILLQLLIEGIRASLGNIRAAIETIEEYPEMDSAKLSQLRKVIYEEALTLSANLNQTTVEYAEDLKASWQLEEMLGSDLLWALQRRFEDKLGVATKVETLQDNLWLKVDSYSIIQAMTFIMRQLQTDFNVNEVVFKLKQTGRLAVLDMVWSDIPTDLETLWGWQNQISITEGQGSPLTLRQVIEQHGGEVWCQTDRANNTTYFRLLLPTLSTKSKPDKPVAIYVEETQYE